VAKHPSSRYFILKSIIISNLFGVDIMEEAVEICKLRLFLKLVAQVNRLEQIEPLPDVDFNIRAGNTLVGYVSLDEIREAVERERGGQKKLAFSDGQEEVAAIEEKALIADRAYQRFREMQTEQGMDASQFTEAKRELRRRLDTLGEELDRYLAAEYGVVPRKREAFAAWLKSHQPFHWFAEFYGIMHRGGFDVIIGNPPYVECKGSNVPYSVRSYATLETKNLYAYVCERSLALMTYGARVGLIVPLAAISVSTTRTLRTQLLMSTGLIWHSSFGFRPAKLFEGVNLRLTILLATKHSTHTRTLSTRYILWSQEERPSLFSKLQYVEATFTDEDHFPKISDPIELSIIAKILGTKVELGTHFVRTGGSVINFHRSPLYWIRAMDFEPRFESATKTRSTYHIRDIRVSTDPLAKLAGCVLNSSTFFFWFSKMCNCRNLTNEDVRDFPVGSPHTHMVERCAVLFKRLMEDYRRNSTTTVRYNCQYETFYPSLSKPIINDIDSILAEHYRFDEEEFDHIVNYDIKYRMGQEDEAEGDE